MLKKLLLVICFGVSSTTFAEKQYHSEKKHFVINIKRINQLIRENYHMSVHKLCGKVRYTFCGKTLSSDIIHKYIKEKFLTIAQSSSNIEEFLTQLTAPETSENYTSILFNSLFDCNDTNGNALERLINLSNNHEENFLAITETIISLYHEYMIYAKNRTLVLPKNKDELKEKIKYSYEFCALIEKTDENTIIIKVNRDWKSLECIDFSVKRLALDNNNSQFN